MTAPDLFATPLPRSSAVLSDDGLYRYSLTRAWAEGDDRVVFVMLNPSTADAENDDPTIRRCIGFAKAWGYPGLAVVNLFAFRATSPADMKVEGDPIGRLNDSVISRSVEGRDVVAAWGAHGSWRGRDKAVLTLLHEAARSVTCLGLTKDGHPRHPLYVPASQARFAMRATR